MKNLPVLPNLLVWLKLRKQFLGSSCFWDVAFKFISSFLSCLVWFSCYFKIYSVKASFSHTSFLLLVHKASQRQRADKYIKLELKLAGVWGTSSLQRTDLNMDGASEASPSEKIPFAWWNHQEKLPHAVRTLHTRTLFWMYENDLNVWKLISKLFFKKLFLVQNIPFRAEATLLRTSVAGLKDKSADILVCPRQHLSRPGSSMWNYLVFVQRF